MTQSPGSSAHTGLGRHVVGADALERLNALSTALLMAVSHDVRTPLATMRLALEGLSTPGISDDERIELLRAVDASAARLEALMDGLLDLSRLKARVGHPLRTCSLDEVLPLVVAGNPPDAVRLEVGDPAPMVTTDATLLERVLANLVSNAVRHSHGTPVRLRADVRVDSVDVIVADRGPGVPPHQREKIFEPFERLGDHTPGGLGLGLTVAHELTKAVGGSLAAAETPGGGLTMVLTLPGPAENVLLPTFRRQRSATAEFSQPQRSTQ